jgi:hypothetical protein
MHVRVYCSPADRVYGCIDLGPMELLAERQAEPSPVSELMAALTAPPATPPASGDAPPPADRAGFSSATPAPAAATEGGAPAGLGAVCRKPAGRKCDAYPSVVVLVAGPRSITDSATMVPRWALKLYGSWSSG